MYVLVAVYGTLKTGEKNYARLLPGREPVFRGFVEIPYRMYENGAYPMIVPADGRSRIFVEVFDVGEDELRELDALEAPYDYFRETVRLVEYGRDVQIYVHAAPPTPGFTAVASGNWKPGAPASRGDRESRE